MEMRRVARQSQVCSLEDPLHNLDVDESAVSNGHQVNWNIDMTIEKPWQGRSTMAVEHLGNAKLAQPCCQ